MGRFSFVDLCRLRHFVCNLAKRCSSTSSSCSTIMRVKCFVPVQVDSQLFGAKKVCVGRECRPRVGDRTSSTRRAYVTNLRRIDKIKRLEYRECREHVLPIQSRVPANKVFFGIHRFHDGKHSQKRLNIITMLKSLSLSLLGIQLLSFVTVSFGTVNVSDSLVDCFKFVAPKVADVSTFAFLLKMVNFRVMSES